MWQVAAWLPVWVTKLLTGVGVATLARATFPSPLQFATRAFLHNFSGAKGCRVASYSTHSTIICARSTMGWYVRWQNPALYTNYVRSNSKILIMDNMDGIKKKRENLKPQEKQNMWKTCFVACAHPPPAFVSGGGGVSGLLDWVGKSECGCGAGGWAVTRSSGTICEWKTVPSAVGRKAVSSAARGHLPAVKYLVRRYIHASSCGMGLCSWSSAIWNPSGSGVFFGRKNHVFTISRFFEFFIIIFPAIVRFSVFQAYYRVRRLASTTASLTDVLEVC